jgi:DNA-binding XRE family transcriptional regulator
MRKTSTRVGGTAMSNTDDERHEPTVTYANRGIPLFGLRPARQRLGFTQRQLASLAGIGQGTVSKLERSERGAYPQTLQKLAVALRVTPAELVGDRIDQ